MNPRTLLVPHRVHDGENPRYVPHQHTREQRRRLRQIRQGTVKGQLVDAAAIYAAHGLTPPGALALIDLR